MLTQSHEDTREIIPEGLAHFVASWLCVEIRSLSAVRIGAFQILRRFFRPDQDIMVNVRSGSENVTMDA